MEAHEIVRLVARKLGNKHLAAEMKVSPKLFQKWTQPVGPAHDGRVNPAERVLQITQITGDPRVLEWICEQAGGRFVRGRELRALACAECERRIAELKAVMKIEAGGKVTGNAGGSRCRYRRRDGRCGFPRAMRN